MKKLFLLGLLVLPFCAASSENSIPPGFEHWTPASIAALETQLSAKAASDPHHFAAQQLPVYQNEYYLYAHRESDGTPELHETEADIFVVQSGTATLVVGGTLLNGEVSAPHEKRGGTIDGGTRQSLSVGDIVRIPAKVPHQVLIATGQKFSYFVVKVKGY
jgi:mannose-6-phosphate isomerase-like protein (cupin superfamily)